MLADLDIVVGTATSADRPGAPHLPGARHARTRRGYGTSLDCAGRTAAFLQADDLATVAETQGLGRCARELDGRQVASVQQKAVAPAPCILVAAQDLSTGMIRNASDREAPGTSIVV